MTNLKDKDTLPRPYGDAIDTAEHGRINGVENGVA